MKIVITLLLLFCSSVFAADNTAEKGDRTMDRSKVEIATLGGGCFWCIEAIFEGFDGVLKVESGYSGGRVPSPTYERVSAGATGHAEVIQIEFDPAVISYHDIVAIFFHVHDPTTLNQQGADVGTQYRSIIFYHSEEQRIVAEEVKREISDAKLWSNPIVTEIAAFSEFYKAEEYHQGYFANNKEKPYCSLVIAPKLKKVFGQFKNKLKKK